MSSKSRLSTARTPLSVSLPNGPAAQPAYSIQAILPIAAMGLILLTSIPAFFGSAIAQRALLAFVILSLVTTLMLVRASLGMIALLCYLSIEGGIRRWLIPVFGWVSTDPLILVGPFITIFLALSTMTGPKNRWSSPIYKSVIVLLAVMVIQVVNPIQGGLIVGVAGIMFYMVPLAWYFIGRASCSPQLTKDLLATVVIMSSLSAAYGIYQVFYGFNQGELMWMKLSNYAALSVTSTQHRAIGFSTSAAEYANLIGLSTVIIFAMFLRGIRLPILLVPFLLTALFLETSRGIFVATLYSCVFLWAFLPTQKAQWIPRLIFASALTIVGMYFVLTKLNDTQMSDQTSALVQHQTQGLLNPLDTKHSSLQTHQGMVVYGITSGFKQPWGHGLGSTTLAGAKFGTTGGSTETDVSDLFFSLGCIGGIAYVVVMCNVFRLAFRSWTRDRSWQHLAILGMLILELGFWLYGDYYDVTMVIWLCIGGLDAANRQYEALTKATLGNKVRSDQEASLRTLSEGSIAGGALNPRVSPAS